MLCQTKHKEKSEVNVPLASMLPSAEPPLMLNKLEAHVYKRWQGNSE